jgi:flagellar biogenesis protein FliO
VNRARWRAAGKFSAIFAGLALWTTLGGSGAARADAPAALSVAPAPISTVASPAAAPQGAIPAGSFDSQAIHRDTTDATPIDSKPIPTDSHPLSFDSSRVMLALGGIVVLILVLKAALRKFLPGAAAARSTRAMQVLSRCTISSRQQLLLIQVGKRLVVAGDCGTQLNPLCEITDPVEVEGLVARIREEAASAAGRFDSLFGKARKEFATDSENAAANSEIASENPVETSSDIADESGDSPVENPAGSAAEPVAAALALSASAPRDSFDPSHELESAEINSSIAKTSEELSGLRQKMRDLSRQIGSA